MHLYKDGRKSTLILDASVLKNSSCILKTFLVAGKGYKSNRPINNDIHFGSCFHLFRAEYRTNGDMLSAVQKAIALWKSTAMFIKPNKKYLTDVFLKRVCWDYAETYPRESDKLIPIENNKEVLIEPTTKFAFPFRCYDDIDILVAGTQDEVAKNTEANYQGGSYVAIVDAKTTSYWNKYEYFESYLYDPQLIMYRWTIKQYAKFKPNSIWAWIDNQPNVRCMIDGVFYSCTSKAEGAIPDVKFHRSDPILFKDWQLEEFEVMLNRFVDELIYWIRNYLKTGKYPPRFGILTASCIDQYGPCEFCPACSAIDEESREAYMDLNFIEREYNPLAFGGVEIK